MEEEEVMQTFCNANDKRDDSVTIHCKQTNPPPSDFQIKSLDRLV